MRRGSTMFARRLVLVVVGVVFLIGWRGGDAGAATGPVFSNETSTHWPQIQFRIDSDAAGGCAYDKPWPSTAAMKDQCWQPVRDSYVYDPGRGEEIGAAQFASAQMVNYYTSSFNYSRNFLFWAPITDVTVGGRTWWGCREDTPGYRVSLTHIGGFCNIDQVQGPTLEDGTLRGHLVLTAVNDSYGGGTIRAKTFGGAFIATPCGNPSTNQRVEGPIPTLGGHTYHDLNRDGARQDGEPFVGGFQLRLLYGSTVVANTTSDANGAYTFSLNADGNGPGRFGEGTYTVQRLDRAGWQSIGTATRSQGVGWASGTTASRNDLDFGAWLPPTMSIADASVVEGTGTNPQLQFTVSLSAATGVAIGADASTASGSATAPADFAATAHRVVVPAGATSATFAVDAVADAIDELDETMAVSLGNADLSVPIADPDAIGTIVDDDTAMVTVGAAEVVEGDPGDDRHLIHPVTLSTPADRELQVAYSTVDGTATGGQDYVGVGGDVVTFPPGVTAQSVDVAVVEDLVDELDERYQLVLQPPSIGELAVGSADGVIDDDDTAMISVADATVVEGDPGGDQHLVHAVTLSTPADRDIVLSHVTTGVTATQDGDYQGVAADLVVPALTTSGTIDVAVIEDLVDELDETYTLTLAAPAVGQLADGEATGTIVDDDTARVHVEPATEIEGDPGDDVRLGHHVVLSTQSDRPVTVPYATVPGTAGADVDYQTTAGALRFDPFVTDLVVEVPVVEDLLVEADETYTIGLDAAGLVNTEPDGPAAVSAVGTILDDDWRQGTMSCRAQGLELLGADLWVANPADHPCAPDHQRLLNVNISNPLLGSLARVQAQAIDAVTEQTFVLPGPVAPADGDRARAAAQTTGLRLTVGLLLDVRANVLATEATATCVGGAPVLRASSRVAGVHLGLATYDTNRPVTVSILGLGTLRLNWVSVGATRATARALWLDLPGTVLDIVIGESTADIHDAPCTSGRPFP